MSAIADQAISCAAVFVVRNIQQSVVFYRDKLGFSVRDVWGDPPSFAIADAPTASVMLKQSVWREDSGEAAPNHARVKHLWDAYIWVRDLDALIADFDARGLAYSPPETAPHGCTETVVEDPDGYRICFGFCP